MKRRDFVTRLGKAAAAWTVVTPRSSASIDSGDERQPWLMPSIALSHRMASSLLECTSFWRLIPRSLRPAWLL